MGKLNILSVSFDKIDICSINYEFAIEMCSISIKQIKNNALISMNCSSSIKYEEK